jgi:hypothetical protein
MVMFYVAAHSGCAVHKTGRRRGTCTPPSWRHDDKFSPLEILAGISYFPVPGTGKIKMYRYAGSPKYRQFTYLFRI